MTHAALTARQARARGREIVERLFGESPRNLRPRSGGLTNAVYQADLSGRSVIVRMNADPSKYQAFMREAAAIRLARRHGIPTPHVLHVGSRPVPHMVLGRAPGMTATGEVATLSLVRELGALAARIHRIPVDGFGHDVLAERLPSSRRKSWVDHLTHELEAPRRIDELERLHVLTSAAAAELRRVLGHMMGWRRNAVLHHGDVRLKNVMIDANARIVCLLDWENSLGSVPVLWDLSIALHDLNIDEKEAFLQGYGLRPQQLARMAPFLKLFNALNYAPIVVRMAERGEGRRLGWQRARLAGHLDLY